MVMQWVIALYALVSGEIKKQLRETDIAGRYGGEEFGIILTNTNAVGGLEFSGKLRKKLNAALLIPSQ